MTNRTYALTGAKACIPGENLAEFDALLSELMSEFQPAAASVRFAVEEFAQLQWKLRRAADVGRDHWSWLSDRIREDGRPVHTVGDVYRRDLNGYDLTNKLARYETLLRRDYRRTLRLAVDLASVQRNSPQSRAARTSREPSRADSATPRPRVSRSEKPVAAPDQPADSSQFDTIDPDCSRSGGILEPAAADRHEPEPPAADSELRPPVACHATERDRNRHSGSSSEERGGSEPAEPGLDALAATSVPAPAKADSSRFDTGFGFPVRGRSLSSIIPVLRALALSD